MRLTPKKDPLWGVRAVVRGLVARLAFPPFQRRGTYRSHWSDVPLGEMRPSAKRGALAHYPPSKAAFKLETSIDQNGEPKTIALD